MGKKTLNEYFYKPAYKDKGIVEMGKFDDALDVADAEIKANVDARHTKNADTDLDPTFEATFVKKTDTANVLSDITSAGANIEDAVTKKHTQGTDQKLDDGGANEVVVADVKDAVAKKHTQGTDTTLGTLTAGIPFPATQVPSANANTLDDYEEGAWTPALKFGGNSVGMTYTTQAGLYTKIGRQVTVTAKIVLTSKGSSEGAATITGLPFAIKNVDGAYSNTQLYFTGVTFANVFQGLIIKGTSYIAVREVLENGTGTDLDNTNFTDTSYIVVSATYFTD